MFNYDNKDSQWFLNLFITGLILIAGLSIISVVHGYVLTKLWSWFIVPTFALPSLGLIQAVGINLVVTFLGSRLSGTRSNDSENDEGKLERLVIDFLWSLVVLPVVYLFLGYMFSFWM